MAKNYQEYKGNLVVTEKYNSFHFFKRKYYEPTDREWTKDARYCKIDKEKN